MPRVARGKKTTESNKVSEEKIDKTEVTPKDQEVPEKLSIQGDKIEEPVLNDSAEAKTIVKATKSARGKKESKNETEKSEPKTKGATKKAALKEVTSNDDKVDEQEVPQVPENKKRVVKKKIEEIVEEVPAVKKRNKKEPVSNGKGSEIDEQAQSTENNMKEAPKKRGGRKTAKTEEEPKVEILQPAKKRSKKTEEVPEEKKKITRRRNAVDEAVVEKSEPEKPVAKKSRSKSAVNEEKVTDEPEKPAPKQAKGKLAKKAVIKEKASPKNPKRKASETSEDNDQVAENVEAKKDVEEIESSSKKSKVTKKDSKEEVKIVEETKSSPKRGKVSKQTEDKVDGNTAAKPTSKKGKIIKQDIEKEENLDEIVEEPKVASPKLAKGKAVAKKAEKPVQAEKKFQNSIESDLSIDFNIKEKWNLKIVTWNISGLRSCVDKGCVEYFKQESPDVICLNEIKCGTDGEIPEKMKLEGYHAYWNIAKGMPGVGVLTKQFPEEVFNDLPGQFSDEKRLITVEFKKYYLVCCYVVNAGRGLKTLDKRLEWNKAFDEYIKDLDKKKPVIIAGDMNVAHSEIDLANPKSNQKNAGFTKEEREGFTQLLSYGFVDTFRQLHPDEKAYTFWSYMNNSRAKNVGWRLDYFLTSERFMDKVKDNVIRSTVKGSDHCPLVLFLNL